MSLIPKTKFMWLLIAVVCYAYYQEYKEKHKYSHNLAENTNQNAVADKNSGESTAVTNNIVAAKNGGLAASVVNKVSQNETGKVIVDALIKKSLEKKYGNSDLSMVAAGESGTIATIDLLQGSGQTMNCGAKAMINYEAFNSHEIKFDTTKLKDTEKPLVVQSGSGRAIKGLEAGIIGMKEGGKRKISIPARLAFDIPGFTNDVILKGESVLYYVDLVTVQEGPYKTPLQVKILKETPQSGNRMLCGDNVSIKYNLSEENGAAIEGGTGMAEFTLGAGSVPMGFEFAVIGMSPGSKKNVQIPYGLLKAAAKNTLPSLPKFKEGAPVNASIELLVAPDKAKEPNKPQAQ